MAATKQKKPDFRDAAVAASATLLAARGDGDPLEAGISYCIRADDAPSPSSKWPMVTAIVVGFGLFVVGCVWAIIAARDADTESAEWRYLLIGLSCAVTGISTLGGFFVAQRMKMIGHVRQRIGEIPDGAFTVSIRSGDADASPFADEDPAVVILHPDRRCVQIEGLRYRYLIHGADALAIRLLGGGEHSTATTYLIYRVGEVTLSLAMTSDRVWKNVFSFFLGGSGKIFDALKGCLRV